MLLMSSAGLKVFPAGQGCLPHSLHLLPMDLTALYSYLKGRGGELGAGLLSQVIKERTRGNGLRL